MYIGKKAILILLILIFVSNSSTYGKELVEEGHISGLIKDSMGVPLQGVLISLITGTFNPKVIKKVTTNGSGKYEIKNLLPGSYSLSANLSSYLPSFKPRIQILSGQLAQINFSLQSLYHKSFSPNSTSETSINNKEDIRSVLRSSSSNRPLLRIIESSNNLDLESIKDVSPEKYDWENTFYLYSKTHSPNLINLDMGQLFTKVVVKRNINSNLHLSTNGTFSNSGFATFNSVLHLKNLNNHSPSMRVSLGTIPYLNQEKSFNKHQQKLNLVNLDFQDRFNLSQFMSIVYGVEFQSGSPLVSFQKVRPRWGFQIRPLTESEISFLRTNSAPQLSRILTPVKQEKLSSVFPVQEDFYNETRLGQVGITHTEVKVDQRIHQNAKFIVRAYSDEFATHNKRFRTGSTIITPVSSTGLNLTYRRTSDSGVQTDLGYTFGGGSKYSIGSKELVPQNYHLMIARVEAQIRASQTTVATTYRWISGVSVTIVDPYQELHRNSAPGLNIMLGQVIPYWERIFPGELEAQFDLRNLFQNKLSDSLENLKEMMHYEFLQPSRSLQGGIRLKF